MKEGRSVFFHLKGPLLALGAALFLLGLGVWVRGNPSTPPSQGPSVSGARGALFLLRPESREILALSLSTGRIDGRIQLDKYPLKVVSTPGGVSVFVLFQDSSAIEVYSSLDFQKQKVIETGLVGIQDLSFSPNGDRVFITHQGGVALTEYRHRLLDLSNPRTLDALPGQGPLISDRRATRLYRGGASGVVSIFGQNLEVLDQGGLPLYFAAFDQQYTGLWGLDEENKVRVLNPQNQELVSIRSQEAKAALPVSQEEGVYFLGANGEEVLVYSPGNVNRLKVISLSQKGEFLAGAGLGALWVLSSDGLVQQIDGEGVQNQWSFNESLEGVEAVVSAVVQEGGGFACF